MENVNQTIELLDCTVRDGNYAVDFKFTEADTRLLVQQLASLGFRWIEVGHGVGLGGSEAGKGSMPATDDRLIRAAKSVSGPARIGSFFIPGIGRSDQLDRAREEGLDFVRIGENAPDIERAFPFVRHAREIGLTPCVNMMKSYAVTPRDFAQKALASAEAGAEIVYCVDSAGSMMPDDVARYFDETRAVTSCPLGFHGHNNLMMVISNCIAALQHHATFLDVTLCGFGRSAGNAPTEILLAVLERMGRKTRFDLFAVMDLIDRYMWPLVGRTRAHDMLGVVSGYSQFHSSFLPKVMAAARRYDADLKRLVAKVALHDPVSLDEAFLESAANELRGSGGQHPSNALVSFSPSGVTRDRISNTLAGVERLLEGMAVAGAKRPLTSSVLQLIPSEKRTENLLLIEQILDDPQMVMGRVVFGTMELLREVVARAEPRVALFVVGPPAGWAGDLAEVLRPLVGRGRVAVTDDRACRQQFLREIVAAAARRWGADALLVYGPDEWLIEALADAHDFATVYSCGPSSSGAARNGWIFLDDLPDARNVRLSFNVILCGITPSVAVASRLVSVLAPGGRFLSIGGLSSAAPPVMAEGGVIEIDLNQAYIGLASRHLAIQRLLGAGAPPP